MTVTVQANPYSGLVATPQSSLPGPDKGYGGKVVAFTGIHTWAGEAAGLVIQLFKAPASYVFLGGLVSVDTTTGSTTIAIGVAGDTARYKAAAALTTINVPTWFFGVFAATASPQVDPPAALGTDTVFQILTAAATAPSSGTIQVTGFFMAT